MILIDEYKECESDEKNNPKDLHAFDSVISILTKLVGKSLGLSRQSRKFSVATYLVCGVRYVGRNLFCRHDPPTENLAFAIIGRRHIIRIESDLVPFSHTQLS